MITRRLFSAYALLEFLKQDDFVTKQLRKLLCEEGKFPSRRTWERRLSQLPANLPAMIGCFGRHLSELLKPWLKDRGVVALDSTALKTGGGIWHKKDRLAGNIPHTSIDTEANWSKSGWHGWWYGWKLHLAVTVGRLWIPLAAEITVANTYDSEVAPLLINELSQHVGIVLGDKHYRAPELFQFCKEHQQCLITPQPGAYPHTDEYVELRRIYHKLRSQSIEPFNGLFKNIFNWRTQLPFKGFLRTKLFALGAVFLFQLVLCYQHLCNSFIGRGIKPLLRAA